MGSDVVSDPAYDDDTDPDSDSDSSVPVTNLWPDCFANVPIEPGELSCGGARGPDCYVAQDPIDASRTLCVGGDRALPESALTAAGVAVRLEQTGSRPLAIVPCCDGGAIAVARLVGGGHHDPATDDPIDFQTALGASLYSTETDLLIGSVFGREHSESGCATEYNGDVAYAGCAYAAMEAVRSLYGVCTGRECVRNTFDGTQAPECL